MKPTNCPNCGAVLKNGKCEYCGTDFIEEKEDCEVIEIYCEDGTLLCSTTKFLNGGYKPYPNTSAKNN